MRLITGASPLTGTIGDDGPFVSGGGGRVVGVVVDGADVGGGNVDVGGTVVAISGRSGGGDPISRSMRANPVVAARIRAAAAAPITTAAEVNRARFRNGGFGITIHQG
jgi:hypothetical protein